MQDEQQATLFCLFDLASAPLKTAQSSRLIIVVPLLFARGICVNKSGASITIAYVETTELVLSRVITYKVLDCFPAIFEEMMRESKVKVSTTMFTITSL